MLTPPTLQLKGYHWHLPGPRAWPAGPCSLHATSRRLSLGSPRCAPPGLGHHVRLRRNPHVRLTHARRCAGQNNMTIYATVVSGSNSASPAINGTVAVRALSTSDRANNLPGTLLGTVVIGTCSAPGYPNSPPNGCYGTIPLPGTLSADTYTFQGQYSGKRPRHPVTTHGNWGLLLTLLCGFVMGISRWSDHHPYRLITPAWLCVCPVAGRLRLVRMTLAARCVLSERLRYCNMWRL